MWFERFADVPLSFSLMPLAQAGLSCREPWPAGSVIAASEEEE